MRISLSHEVQSSYRKRHPEFDEEAVLCCKIAFKC